MKYEYYVAYKYDIGYGNCSMTKKKEIEKASDIQDIARELEKSENVKGVSITNIILIRIIKEPYENED